ncbi:MAG: signal peptide peptidase SppA [Pelagibacteraceae bacterium TMED124]|nr:signal peptide peptidase SppA [Rickettsiales bacterium]RPG16531.1 MAG: signal peptide peptidase SppA [Pelagibacteraceae bacterium TMED124]
MKKNDFLIQYFEKRKSKILNFFIFFLLIFFLIFIFNNTFSPKNFIGKIHLEGVISDKNEFIKQLNEISQNRNVKGLLIIVNSPGGTFVSSKEIHDTLEKISTQMPTSVYMREMGTSGAYLASLGAEKIFANQGTITGSIGVILQTAQLTSLMEKIGVKPIVIKSGELKATPNPLEKLDEEKINYLKKIIGQLQNEFIYIVKKKRNLNSTTLEKISSGRIFTSKQALDLNLIDFIGNENDALDWIKKEGKLDQKIDVIEIDKKNSLLDLMNTRFFKNSLKPFNLNPNNGILAIWTPGL